ncbi:hypothetical protein AB733_15470 [Photobacterium swingsii]|uniref:Uncharacterized protein n=1 Tax=Photobacterium swingsii TaxID=680026 RepID=A0A0J8VBG0_9GAMM|nr:hypothetical protein [Photobacterium swingsii]KMV29890.1 hypothetical protein AB733_15470 [Photobacterium swingsii]PSW26022.1 hypothetical protein C9I94_05590 [Photobacterium swingsii]
MKKVIEFIAMSFIYPFVILFMLVCFLIFIPMNFMGPALFTNESGLIPNPNKKGWAVIYAFYAIVISCVYGVSYLVERLA